MRNTIFVIALIMCGVVMLGGLMGATAFTPTEGAAIRGSINWLIAAVGLCSGAIVMMLYAQGGQVEVKSTASNAPVTVEPPALLDPAKRAAARRRALKWSVVAAVVLAGLGVGSKLVSDYVNRPSAAGTPAYYDCVKRGDAKNKDVEGVRRRCADDTDTVFTDEIVKAGAITPAGVATPVYDGAPPTYDAETNAETEHAAMRALFAHCSKEAKSWKKGARLRAIAGKNDGALIANVSVRLPPDDSLTYRVSFGDDGKPRLWRAETKISATLCGVPTVDSDFELTK